LDGLIDAMQFMRRCKGTVKCFRKSDGVLLSSRKFYTPKKTAVAAVEKPVENDDE
jgi:hypothetical protein